jgi:hypothetical protein
MAALLNLEFAHGPTPVREIFAAAAAVARVTACVGGRPVAHWDVVLSPEIPIPPD